MTLLAINWAALAANLGQFILAFSILIVLHELGHFLTAKWFGCRVEKFYLFFNPWFSLWKKKIGETEYGIGWVPLGGYVKISGMIDESMDKEAMKLPPEPYEFRSKPAWQRLIIMLAGVIINFVLALVIFSMVLFAWGQERLPVSSLKYGLATDSLGNTAGIKSGDVIKAVNGKPVEYVENIGKDIYLTGHATLLVTRDGKDTNVVVPSGFWSALTKAEARGFVAPRIPMYVDTFSDKKKIVYKGEGRLMKNDQIVAINGTPTPFNDSYFRAVRKLKNQDIQITVLRNNTDTVNVPVHTDENGSIGFVARGYDEILQLEQKNFTFFQSIPAGINYGVDRLGDYVQGLRLLFVSKEHKVNENLGSLISIGKTFGGEWDWRRFWELTAMFSIILAFMNILPIPALDGGHALFTLIEMITGRKPSDKFMEYAQLVGMVLMLGLMAYALGLDIFRLFK